MTIESFERALDSAADRFGVESKFWDIFGREHPASLDTKRAIVAAFGVPVDSAEAISAALRESEREQWTRLLAPTIVALKQDFGCEIPVRVRESELASEVRFSITLESGERFEFAHSLAGMKPADYREFDGIWHLFQVRVERGIPLGYHSITARCGKLASDASLVIAPKCAYVPDDLAKGAKRAGFAVALYGLQSERNWGLGDFTDLKRLSVWCARELGVSFLALNPLHAIPNRRPYNTSPYLPISIFFQNCLYLDIEAVEEFATSRRAQRCFASAATKREIAVLRSSPEVEYERVHQLKSRFLKLLFGEFLRKHWRKKSPRAQAFLQFQREAGDLLTRFGLYCALNEHIHAKSPDVWIWPDWPPEYQDPNSPQSQAFARRHWRSVLYHQYAAWETVLQLEAAQQHAREAGLPIGLYHDLALATDRFGSDIWAHRDFFAPGCRVGSPPDDFSPNGQDWGFPPPNTKRHREDGYHLFRESISRTAEHGGALRIDHVMRFFRLYWIPDGMNATQGAYVRDRAEDLVRILALESVRHQFVVVGEDLGTVEPYIREMLAEYGILSYRLFYFERSQDGGYRMPADYPRQALVSSTTHDLPTLAGFWKGSDIEARKRAGLLDDAAYRSQWQDRVRDRQRMLDSLYKAGVIREEVPRDANHIPELTAPLHNAILEFLASTPSMFWLVNQEDLTLEQFQQNLPGSTSQYPNWGRKMLFTIEQLETDERARALTARIRRHLESSGRALSR